MAAPDDSAIEQALVARIRAITGLADGQVYMADQKGGVRTPPYVTLSLGDAVSLGAFPDTTTAYNAGGAAGAEIVKTTRGIFEFFVNLQAWSAVVRGAGTALALLKAVAVGIHSPASKAALDLVGFTVIASQAVKALPAEVFTTEHQSRASLSLLCHVALEQSETTGYIASGSLKFRTKASDAFKTYPI